jgi:hypothetical protein
MFSHGHFNKCEEWAVAQVNKKGLLFYGRKSLKKLWENVGYHPIVDLTKRSYPDGKAEKI